VSEAVAPVHDGTQAALTPVRTPAYVCVRVCEREKRTRVCVSVGERERERWAAASLWAFTIAVT
jgi:hypothetical protein